MVHNNNQVLAHWDDENVESMYDKHLLSAEVRLISAHLQSDTKILDAGCGEGEGTVEYCQIRGTRVHAVDFSTTRLAKAEQRLGGCDNVALRQVDFLGEYDLDHDYDVIISQRFLINLMEWRLQQKVLSDLMGRLRPGGKLLMLEGSKSGVDELNELRVTLELPPIGIKWHNLFFEDDELLAFMSGLGHRLAEVEGMGAYFMLTRGVRPLLDSELDWAHPFNERAAAESVERILGFGSRFSRLKLWVFEKGQDRSQVARQA